MFIQHHIILTVMLLLSGSPAYDSVRSLAYQEADVFLACYKISDPISLYNVTHKWVTEIRRSRPGVPIVLCGCQADLREDPPTLSQLSKTGRAPVSREQGLAVCCQVDAVNYVETSAKAPQTDREVQEAFELCALAVLKCKTSGGGMGGMGGIGTSRSFTKSTSSSSWKLNVSFGSAEKRTNSASSSLKKSSCRLSLSGSENDLTHSTVAAANVAASTPILEDGDDDVFPGLSDQLPHRLDHRRRPHRSSLVALKACTPPEHQLAQVRPNGLARRTSFRAPLPPPPVVNNNQKGQKAVLGFESLKSHSSTGSTGSSKASSGSAEPAESTIVPDTEDPRLLAQLKFVSPKSGVFRPANSGSSPTLNNNNSKKKQHQQGCCVM